MEGQPNNSGSSKRPLDEIIENMTADLHDSDGQYIQLGFSHHPPPQQHWSPYYVADHEPFLASRAPSFIPNDYYVYTPPLYVRSEPAPNLQQQHPPQQQQPLYSFRPDNEFGLFSSNSQNQERNLIENLVGNWSSSTGSGTYSPFGGTAPNTTERVLEQPEERSVPKKRIVAEVKPMRPSYSDIVSKSPPTKVRTLSPNVSKVEAKPVKTALKGAGKSASGNKKNNSTLKRQHSAEDNMKTDTNAPLTFARTKEAEEQDSVLGDKLKANKTAEGPLNNHKVSRPGAAKRTLHINNNLKPPASSSVKNKQCKTCGEETRSVSSGNSGNSKNESKSGAKTRSSSQARDKQHGNSGSGGSRKNKNKKKACPYSFNAVWPVLRCHIVQWASVVMQLLAWFINLISDVLGMSSKLAWHLCGATYTKVKLWVADLCTQVRAYFPLNRDSSTSWKRRWASWLPSWWKKDNWEPEVKLETNLPLPATGEEAMKRLLACRGKDPYSILGVAPTCTDDDIKRYYKRQAFLVHPDKNSQPGAEEAFKILVHAFDLIGEPEKRQVYDCSVARCQQKDATWSELSDLLAQLHQKMEEAANTIRCTNCKKRHRRIPVDRPSYAARACSQCNIRHAAREGDIWAESSMLGFLWHYYACMEGGVYDITEWAACQADSLRHLRANSHVVQYRIVLGKKQHSSPNSRRSPEPPGEADLEDFLNSLYGDNSSSRKHSDQSQRHVDNSRKRKAKRKK